MLPGANIAPLRKMAFAHLFALIIIKLEILLLEQECYNVDYTFYFDKTAEYFLAALDAGYISALIEKGFQTWQTWAGGFFD